MIKKRVVTDAPESNAGDDFHILWSVRKAIDLLHFNPDGLMAVTLEGPEAKDGEETNAEGDKLLAVDVGEYYGGERFAEASKVVFSQLKYSSRHSERHWSISSICEGKKKDKKHDGSIIHRLAQLFKALVEQYESPDVKRKVKLKLISNRPFAHASQQLILNCQKLIEQGDRKFGKADLLRSLDKASHGELEKLFSASKLSVALFIEFLTLLDFSECGAAARQVLKLDTINAISRINAVSNIDRFNNLYVFISGKMMPENRKHNIITLIDLLKAFNYNSISSIFPVPSKVSEPRALVHRKQTSIIENTIFDSPSSKICIHAGGGMGKTTLLNTICKSNSNNSEFIFFDCYGEGNLDPLDKRHKHQWGIVQICNEMAVNIGTSFMLIQPGQPDEVYLREFLIRIEQAAEILKARNEKAQLHLIIDAADNSIMSAKISREKSFVEDLIQMKLPERCKIIFTCRTHRIASLNLHSSTFQMQLNPFEISETESHIRNFKPEVSEAEIEEFHRLTRGIPRVQTYSLSGPDSEFKEMVSPLLPDGKDVDALIQANIDFVISKIGDRDSVELFLRYVSILPRPLPIDILSKVTALEKPAIEDIATDISFGLIYEHTSFSFKDEDFETFLTSAYPADENDFIQISDLLRELAESQAYASINLGRFLLLANRYEDLKDIVLSRKFLSLPNDPIVLREIFTERARQTMRLSILENNNLDFIKVQVVAAEAAKTNQTLFNLLRENADLTAQFGNAETLKKLYIDSDQSWWFGPIHYRSAAIFSRNKETMVEAKKHFDAAVQWFSWRLRLPSIERKTYSLESDDMAFAAEAILRINSAKGASQWLSGYYPWFQNKILDSLMPNLIDHSSHDQLLEWLSELELSFGFKLRVIAEFARSGIKAPFTAEEILTEIEARFGTRRMLSRQTKNDLLDACEYFAFEGCPADILSRLLNYVTFALPSNYPRFYSTFSQQKEVEHLDNCIRRHCLLASLEGKEVKIADFYTRSVIAKLEDKSFPYDDPNNDKKRFDTFYEPIVFLFKQKTLYYLNKITESEFLQATKEKFNQNTYSWEAYQFEREIPYLNIHYTVVFSRLLNTLLAKKKFLALLLKIFGRKTDPVVPKLLSIAKQTSRVRKLDVITLELVKEAGDKIFKGYTHAENKSQGFLSCVRIANRLDEKIGSFYFEKMVESLSEMDIEGFDQIRLLKFLSENISSRQPSIAFEFSRFTEFCNQRLSNWDHFPWRDALQGISNLDPNGCLAILCRWDDKRYIKLEQLLNKAIKVPTSKQIFSAEIAAGVLAVSNNYNEDFEQQITNILAKTSTNSERFVEHIFKLIRFQSPFYMQGSISKLLLEKLENTKTISGALINDIRSFVNFQSKYSESRSKSKLKRKIDFSKLSLDTFGEIPAFLTKNVKGSFDTREILLQITDRISLKQQVSYLDFVINLEGHLSDFNSFIYLIDDLIQKWRTNPRVIEWCEDKFDYVLETKYLPEQQYGDLTSFSRLKQISEAFGIDRKSLAGHIKKLIINHVDEFSASQLYLFSYFTVAELSEIETTNLLMWILERWNRKINDSEIPAFTEHDQVGESLAQTFGPMFQYLLGHSNKEMRFRAAHSLRHLVSYGEESILRYLLENQDSDTCYPYQDRSHIFFSQSFKNYLWMTVLRISREHPKALTTTIPYALKAIDLDNAKHAMILNDIQELSKVLSKKMPELFRKKELKKFEAILGPRADKPSKKYKLPKITTVGEMFPFDSTDTIPYWYNRLGSIFGLNQSETVSILDKIIKDEMGFAGDIDLVDHVYSGDDYYSTTNRHGSLPRIENLRRYFEYNAMFLATVYLISSKPISEEKYRSFRSWLKSWSTTGKKYWLADLRDAVPLENVFHDSMMDDQWEANIDDGYLLRFVNPRKGMITVSGNMDIYYGKDREDIEITSALVKLDKARSLQAALQDAPYYRYKLPTEKEPAHEITEPGFELLGWLREVSGRDNANDHFDPFANGIKTSFTTFGKRFLKSNGYKLRDNEKTLHLKQKKVAQVEIWNNTSNETGYHNTTTSGTRLVFDLLELKRSLKKADSCLILECKITRYKDSVRGKSKDNSKKLLYIIDRNGKASLFTGNIKLR